MKRRSFLQTCALVAGACSAGLPLRPIRGKATMKKPAGRQCVWNGRGNGEWSDPANWEGGIKPRNGDVVYIKCDTGRTLMLADADVCLASLVMIRGSVGHRPAAITVRTSPVRA